MDLTPVTYHIVDFAAFLSRAYGTGDFNTDAFIAVAIVSGLLLVTSILRIVGDERPPSLRRLEALDSIQEIVCQIQVQVMEMQTCIRTEFERFRMEFGYLKQELVDFKNIRSTRDRIELTHPRNSNFVEGSFLYSMDGDDDEETDYSIRH